MSDDRPVSLAAVTAVFIAPYKGMAPEDGWLTYIRAALESLPTVAPATHGGREAGDTSNRIVNAIIEDLSDRRGLRHEWDQVGDDVREEIMQEWRDIVDARLVEADKHATPPKPSPAPKSVEEMAAEMGYAKCAHPTCEGYGNNTGECVSERTIIRLYAEHTAKPPAPVEMPKPLADLSRVPAVLTVVLADTWVTECAIVHENEHRPYKRRTVHIELTDEQRAEMAPHDIGESRGKPAYEVVLTSWLEDSTPLRRVPE